MSRVVTDGVRIVYLHQYFNTTGMPGGTRSFEYARRLVEMGHSVDMITTDRTGERTPKKGWVVSEESGIRVHWTYVPYANVMSYRDRLRAFGRYAVLAGPRAASLHPDVVYASSTPLTVALPGVFAARRACAPMVLEIRDLWPEIPMAIGALRNPVTRVSAAWLERFAYRNAARIVALSPGMRDGVVARGYPAGRVVVIPNACDLDLFATASNAGAHLRETDPWLAVDSLIVYCGTVGLVNGVDYLVRVASEMLHLNPAVRFLVVGEGRCLHDVKALAEQMGVLGVNMRFMDEVPKKDMPAILGAATLAVSTVIDVPELHANSANKFFDAIAAGTPMVINHEGWLADLIRESGVGLAVPAGDHVVAAKEIDAVLRSRDELTAMSDRALQLARTRFGRDLLAQQLENVLLSAVAKVG